MRPPTNEHRPGGCWLPLIGVYREHNVGIAGKCEAMRDGQGAVDGNSGIEQGSCVANRVNASRLNLPHGMFDQRYVRLFA